MFTQGVVETHDPQGTKGTLFVAAISVRIFASLDHGFFGFGKEFLASPAEALGFFENIVVALFGHDATLDSGHRR